MTTTSPTPAVQPFSFAGMAGLSSTTSPETAPDDGYVPPVENDAKVSPTAAEPKKEDDEDDLVIGEQLDAVSPPSASTNADETPSNSGATTGGENDSVTPSESNDTAGSDNEPAPEEANDGGSAPHGGQMDPRLAQQIAAAQAAERGGQRQGGGGGSPGLSGLVAGAASGTVGLLGGGFKMLGNGIKAVRGTPDRSLPRPLTVAEKIGTADPNKAEAYWQNAGDESVREKIYRDAFEGMNSNIAEARGAERAFQEGINEMRDVLERSPLREKAEAAQTSIGDYVHGINSGTIQDAAAKAMVQTLEQSDDFKAAESKIVSAGKTFEEKADAALTKMKTIETSFPDRADTSLKKQQLSDIADGMKNDDVSKASAKVKKIMDEIESMANALKEAIRKALDKVVSIFQPK
ncbi:hypothetical protein O9X98_09465 [Agrobacterium salinitolerans]|nr:hypothetical protein [Agrobacterium salinitolerans]